LGLTPPALTSLQVRLQIGGNIKMQRDLKIVAAHEAILLFGVT
jgi:hypothetical protein